MQAHHHNRTGHLKPAEHLQRESPCDMNSDHASVLAGAIRGFVLYSIAEPWSFATVVTLCGIEKVIPVARTLPGSNEVGLQISTTSFLGRLMSFLLWPLKQLSTPTRATAHDEWPVLYDVNGMWHNSFAATAWAFDNLISLCQETEQTIAIQVTCNNSCLCLLLQVTLVTKAVAGLISVLAL